MALELLSTILRIPVKAQLGFLKIDASIKENHTRSARMTELEVEDGSIISDHVVLDPAGLTMEGLISSAPVGIFGLGVSQDDILGSAKDFVNGDKNAFSDLSDSFTSQFQEKKKEATTEDLVKRANRTPKEAWAYLEELLILRRPFSIVTSLQNYTNMIITSLSAPRSATDGESLMFSAQLKEIRIVKSSVVKIPAFKIADGNSAATKGKLGKNSSDAANASQTDNSSILLKGFKKVGIFN